jgi:cell wall-associated NlpC family hydrolase
MPRLAEQQATLGARVPINQLRPGDLVAGPHHIAVYAGNGMMYEAPRTGLSVRLTPVRSGMTGVALSF